MMDKLKALLTTISSKLDAGGAWIGLLSVRLLMGYEYSVAGFTKYGGSNYFARFQENFPFPFNVLPIELSWFLATWTEIIGGIMLFFGLFTRFWAFSLIILTIVAALGVHWPAEWSSLAELWDGYRITSKDGSGNFRLPLLFFAMLLALMFNGAGKLSLDHVVAKYWK